MQVTKHIAVTLVKRRYAMYAGRYKSSNKPSIPKKQIVNENEVKFYSSLGKLSTLFANLEYLIREITGLYIVKDSHQEMVYLSILGRNSLEKNTSLLKELAYISSFGDRQKYLLKLIGDVNSIKNIRNLFIHGIWDSPEVENGRVFITCYDRSFKLKKEIDKNQQVLSYNPKIAERFSLSTIQRHIELLEDLVNRLNQVLKEIEEDPTQYFD